MNFKNYLLVIFLGLQLRLVKAQCTAPDFQLPSNACLNQNIYLSPDAPLTNYSWDFCSGDFDVNPTASVFYNQAGAAFNVELIEQAGQYFGFYVSRTNRKLYRIDFGSNVMGNPSFTDLGDLGIASSGWLTIQIVKEGNQYYGFIIDFYNKLYRFNLGSDVTNSPSTAETLYQDNLLSSPIGLEVLEDETGKYAFIANFGSTSITRFLFSNSFADPIASISIDNNVTVTGSGNLSGISFIRECNTWYAMTTSLSGTISKILFGNGLSDNGPTVSLITGLSFTPSTPSGVSLVFENSKYYAFVQSNQSTSNLYKIDFGNSMANSPLGSSTDFGDLGMLTYSWGFSMHKVKSDWLVLSSDNIGQNIYRITFPNNCISTVTYSSVQNNVIQPVNSGNFSIELSTINSYGSGSSISKSITVSGAQSPDLSFNSQYNCVNNNVNFASQNISGGITTYAWDFGDGENSSEINPSHSYSIASTYQVTLTTTASNSCQNFVHQQQPIFNQPVASFDLPASSPICTNQNYSFTNTSTYDNGSNPTWQWSVNGVDVASTQDLNYLIPSTTPQNIILTASIPGCSSQSLQNISTVQDGPIVNFSSPAWACQSMPAIFTNSSTGTITNFIWDFGDGNTSSQTNGSNVYASSGTFPVTLTASNTAGCQNFLTKNFLVYSNPQPDFSIEAPPYSCANYPAQFDNNTPPLVDSNIVAWAWSFGDAANGTSNQKNPSYTYAIASNYNVALQATSNFGCVAAKQKNITINTSPLAGFTNTPACVNQNTIFTDASSGSITSYQWVIQGVSFTGISPPPYVFKSDGTYPVTLTTTSGNGCKNQVAKNISVPVPPVMDFIYAPSCVGKPTIFQEANPGGPDPSVAWNWNFGLTSGVGSPVDYSFTAPGVYLVTLSATRSSGCVYSTSKTTTIYDGPFAKFTPSTQSGAPPLAIIFNNESIADSYFWEFDYGNSTSNEVSPAFTYAELGEYQVLLTASNIHGCTDTVSTRIYVVIPKVDLAMKNFSLVQDPNSNSSSPVVTILNLGNIPMANPEVQIDLGGNAQLKEKITSTILPGKSIQQTLSLEITPQSLGYICAEVAPTGDTNIYNDRQCLSLTDDDVLFYPYPNPAKGQLNFDWISTENENVEVTIFKSTGQVTFQQTFQLVQSGINQLAIDISSLSSGLYLVQFSGAKVKKTFNVMVIN